MKKIIFVALFFLFAGNASAASYTPEVSGWIPWWQDTKGIKSASKNISDLDIINPFVYEVDSYGHLKDKANITEKQWQKLFYTAERKGKVVMPTLAWSNGAAIDETLSSETARKTHIAEIVKMVEEGDYDGVDIDYESKLAKTKDSFSAFLVELKAALGDKKLSCAIEARTPPEDLYRTVPENIQYANDYKVIAEACDWVEIMTYDQQRADLTLNDARKGLPYIPVADNEWVEKVILLALEDIPAEKIMIGVPTYGRVWELTVAPEWYKEYTSVKAVNLPAAKSLAKKNKVSASRNAAGEMSFSYIDKKASYYKAVNKMSVPSGTPKGFQAAAKALAYANKTGETVTVYVAWYPDSSSFKDKVDLAEKYGLKGVAIFKVDGEEDSKIWKAI